MATYETRYVGPTDTRGARIIVTADDRNARYAVPYDHAARDAHESALRTALGTQEAQYAGTVRAVGDHYSGQGAVARVWEVGNLSADDALDRIADILRAPEWNGADDMPAIAEIVSATGRNLDDD